MLQPRTFLTVVLWVLLALALLRYTVGLRTDDFDGDEYWYAVSADRDFSAFLLEDSIMYRPQLGWQFGPIFYATRWFVEGEGTGDAYPSRLVWTRIPSIVAGLLLILVTWRACRRFWPEHAHMAVLVCAFLAFHSESLRYMRWGMHIFSEYFLLMTCLFFLFLSLLRGAVSARQRVAMGVLSVVIPLVYFPTLPAFVVGFCLVLVHRTLGDDSPSQCGWIANLRALAPFALAIPAYALAYLFEPWDQTARPTLLPWYFESSGYAQSLAGAVEYAGKRTARLFGTLVLVRTGLPYMANVALGLGCLVLVAVGAARTLWVVAARLLSRDSSSHDAENDLNPGHPHRMFTLAYVVIICAGTLTLSFLGLYPYGSIRYYLYLVVPVLVLAGYGFSDLATLARVPHVLTERRKTAIAAGGVILLITIGAVTVLDSFQRRDQRQAVNERLRELLRSSRETLTFYGSSTERFYDVYAPSALDDAVPMGFTRQNQKGAMNDPGETVLARIDAQARSGGDLTVAYWGRGLPSQNHPQFTSMLAEHGWHLADVVWRADRITSLGIARFQYDPEREPRQPLLGLSVVDQVRDEVLYVRGWLAYHEGLDEIVLEVDGDASDHVTYPTPQRDWTTVPERFEDTWCPFEARIPHDDETTHIKLVARSATGEIAQLTYEWPEPAD